MNDPGYTYYQGLTPVQGQQQPMGSQGSFYPQSPVMGSAFQRNAGGYDPTNGIAPGNTNGHITGNDPTQTGYLNGGSWFGNINPQYFQGGNLTGYQSDPFLSGLNQQQLSQLTHNLGGNSHNLGDSWNQGGVDMHYGTVNNGGNTQNTEYANFLGQSYAQPQYQALFDQFNQQTQAFRQPGGKNDLPSFAPNVPTASSFGDITSFAQQNPWLQNSNNDYFKQLYQYYGQPNQGLATSTRY